MTATGVDPRMSCGHATRKDPQASLLRFSRRVLGVFPALNPDGSDEVEAGSGPSFPLLFRNTSGGRFQRISAELLTG